MGLRANERRRDR